MKLSVKVSYYRKNLQVQQAAAALLKTPPNERLETIRRILFMKDGSDPSVPSQLVLIRGEPVYHCAIAAPN